MTTAPCCPSNKTMTKTAQWSKKLDEEPRVSTWPPNSRTSLGPTGKSPIHGGPMSLTTGPKGSTANTQVPETRTTPEVLFTCLLGSGCLSHCGAAIDWTCPRRSHWCSIWLESGEVEGQVDTSGHLLAVFVVFQGTLSCWDIAMRGWTWSAAVFCGWCVSKDPRLPCRRFNCNKLIDVIYFTCQSF